MRYILVEYEISSGGYSTETKIVLGVPEKTKDTAIIHNYFKDFWGESTQTEVKLRLYSGHGYQVAVKVLKYTYIEPKDVAVLRKYINF